MKDAANVSRRKFLGYAGVMAGASIVISSCKKENEPAPTTSGATDLGMNDTGLLNLMFVILQIQGRMYELVVENPFVGIPQRTLGMMERIRDHKFAQREFLRNYLDTKAIVVGTDFSIVDFTDGNSVMENMELLENLAVGTYNDLARLFTSDKHVAIACKIGSVTARHAATVSNWRNYGTFFGPVDVIGAEPGIQPANAITTLNRYLKTKVEGNNLPNK